MANTLTPFGAARRAGVRRVVHISITNPSRESHLESFSGKARLEQALIESGMSYAILRPTVLFGKEDIHCAANFRATAFYSLYALKHLGWSLLWLRRSGWRNVGLTHSATWGRTIGIALLLAAAFQAISIT